MADNVKITKLKLSDGNIYSFFDKDALHFDIDSGKLLVGDTFIDNVLIQNNLFILEIDDVDVNEYTKILVQNDATGEIAKRDKNKMLEDIGGCSYNLDEQTGVLSLKIGKQ